MAHEQYASCINACNACASGCDHCSVACLGEADPKPFVGCIALDIDCAQLCRLTAGYLARGSSLAGSTCEYCATVCERCAEECMRHVTTEHVVEHCRLCAEACYRCAEECRRVAGLLGGDATAASL